MQAVSEGTGLTFHAESAGAVIDLATRGRKRGQCAVIATQRLSKLHKDAAAEMKNKLIGGTSPVRPMRAPMLFLERP